MKENIKTGWEKWEEAKSEADKQLLFSYDEMQDEIKRCKKSDLYIWAAIGFVGGMMFMGLLASIHIIIFN